MKLNKGVNRDVEHSNQEEGSYRDANNLALSKRGDYLFSELGSTKQFDLGADEVMVGVISTNDAAVLFSVDTDDRSSKIYLFKDGVKTRIINTIYLAFNPAYPISGEYKYNIDGDLIVLFYSDNDVPRIINVDSLGLALNTDDELINPSNIVYTRLFTNFYQPNILLQQVNNNGGNLLSGIYYLCIQYKLIDESYTNYSLLTNPIYVYKFNAKDDWYNIYANKSSEGTSKSITVKITNLDDRFTAYRFGIIYKSQEDIKAFVTSDYYITNGEITISDTNNLTSINLEDILVANSIFKRVKSSTQIYNRLYTSNVEVDEVIKYQKYACNITVEPVFSKIVNLDRYENSYKDETILFNDKGFMPFEVYALYIRFIKKDGSVTQAYHIPGRAVSNYYKSPTSDENALEVYDNAKRFHFNDASDPDELEMGMWENENEFYPNDDEFDGTVNYDGNPITGINLKPDEDGNSFNVRHHRFPSIKQMQDYSYPIFDSDATIEKNITITFANPNSGVKPFCTFDHLDSEGVGEFVNQFTYKNTTGNIVNGTLDAHFNIYAFLPLTISLVRCRILVLDNYGTELIQLYDSGSPAPLVQVNQNGLAVVLNPDEHIQVQIYAVNPVTGKHNTSYRVDRSGSCVTTTTDITSDSSLTSRIFGIKVKNIYIPDYIKLECTHYEILYAERTTSNMSVLSTGFITKDKEAIVEGNYRRLYSYDLLNNKPSLNIAYIRAELKISTSIFQGVSAITPSLDNAINPVDTAKYILNNIGYTIPSNTGFEEFISIELTNDGLTRTPEHVSKGGDNDTSNVVSIMNFNANLYTSFANQRLVRTGVIVRINNIGATNSDAIYGGDILSSLHGNIQYRTGDDGAYARNYLVPQFSINNIGYRYTDDDPINLFYPKHNIITGNAGEGIGVAYPYGIVDGGEGSVLLAIREQHPTGVEDTQVEVEELIEYYGYETILNSVLNIEASIIYDINASFNYKFPNRITRSIVQASESKNEAWRTFKVNEYYDSVNNREEIVTIDTDTNTLLVEHKYALIILKAINELKFANGIVSALGDADIFDNKPIEIIPTDDGYVGCQSKFGSIITKFGNTIVDKQRGKIFLYNAGKVEEITKHGISDWMENNLKYDTTILEGAAYQFDDEEIIQFDDSEDVEYIEATENNIVYDAIDNPYSEVGIIVAYDENLERLIVTKQNRIYVKSTNSYVDTSWSWSYYLAHKKWVSRLGITPNMIWSNRSGVFAVHNYENRGVYNILHGVDNPANFFLTTNAVSTVDVVFNLPVGVDKRFNSFNWNTVVTKLNQVFYNETFGDCVIYGYNQHSNAFKLVYQTFDAGNITNVTGKWTLNNFMDVLKTKTKVLIDSLDEQELQVESLDGADIVDNWYDKTQMTGNFIVLRLKFANTDNKSIKINSIGTSGKVITRI